jgi:hypothetical protein
MIFHPYHRPMGILVPHGGIYTIYSHPVCSILRINAVDGLKKVRTGGDRCTTDSAHHRHPITLIYRSTSACPHTMVIIAPAARKGPNGILDFLPLPKNIIKGSAAIPTIKLDRKT